MQNKPNMERFFLRIVFFGCAALFLIQAQAAAANTVVKFALGGHDIERDKYKTDLIKQILDNSGLDFSLYYYQKPGGHAIQIERVKRGTITIQSFGAYAELERKLIPIRVPIFKGLIGYRIFLINKKDQKKFSKIKTLDDLRKLTGMEGKGWTDIKIMEDAGLPQREVSGNAIYRMLNRGGRADYFSRAVYEAVGELQTLKTAYPDIAIEKRIFLTYPFAMYFYVSPKYPGLAEMLRRSFQELVESGRFDRFFYRHHYIRSAIEKANLDNRVKFNIPNKYLSSETRKLPRSYWFDMDKFNSCSNK